MQSFWLFCEDLGVFLMAKKDPNVILFAAHSLKDHGLAMVKPKSNVEFHKDLVELFDHTVTQVEVPNKKTCFYPPTFYLVQTDNKRFLFGFMSVPNLCSNVREVSVSWETSTVWFQTI